MSLFQGAGGTMGGWIGENQEVGVSLPIACAELNFRPCKRGLRGNARALAHASAKSSGDTPPGPTPEKRSKNSRRLAESFSFSNSASKSDGCGVVEAFAATLAF